MSKLISLNIGCSDVHVSGHVNIDLDPNNNPEVLADATKLDLLYEPESVGHILCSHILEHMPRDYGMRMLRSCYKVLAPHGVLTVIVPDWKKASLLPHAQAESTILGLGQHMRLIDEEVLVADLKEVFPQVTLAPVHELMHPIHRHSPAQSAVIAIKHPTVVFKYVYRNDDPQSLRDWKDNMNKDWAANPVPGCDVSENI